MKIARSESFKTAWMHLSEAQRVSARKAIRHLVNDMRYPALRVKKMKGTDFIWEARVKRSIRITFQIDRDIIILRNIGQHDDTLKNP
jgi:mRNA-degrading endonuclease RelE of RelBE toxin-antitoxin system